MPDQGKLVKEYTKLVKEHDTLSKKLKVAENLLRKLNDQMAKMVPADKGWNKVVQAIPKASQECAKISMAAHQMFEKKQKLADTLAKS